MKLRDLHLDNVERAIACVLMPMLCRHANQSKYRTAGEVASVNLPLIMPWRSALPSPACATSVCRLVAQHLPNFHMLEAGPMVGRLAAVPLLIFSAPYLIMHKTLRGDPLERRRGEVVMVATVIAGLRSLMSGTVVVMALQALLSV